MPQVHDAPGGAPPPAAMATAMDRVLAAERSAHAEVDACRGRCEARIAAARLEAHELRERAEALARAIHARTERVAGERAARAVAGAVPVESVGGVELAVARVLAALLGPDDDGDAP